jgi:hypothetical protein
MRHFIERLTQPSTTLAELASEALAATFVMARAHSDPRGQLLGTREACHVGPEFG